MFDWNKIFSLPPGRRPRLAIAILLTVMMGFVVAMPLIPNIGLAWIPVGLLLVLLFYRIGWLSRETETGEETLPIEKPVLLTKKSPSPTSSMANSLLPKLLSALIGAVLLITFALYYQRFISLGILTTVYVLAVPFAALALWLNFRRPPQQR